MKRISSRSSGKARLCFQILIENHLRRTRISKRRLSRWTEKILGSLGWKRASLSLSLVSDARIRKLHHRFLGIDEPTDVLAFPQLEGKFFPQPKTPFLGDLVVSVETAKRVGPQFGNRWDEELLLYICHGILHLMGYRDSTRRQKARMEEKQTRLLRKVLGPLWRSKRRKHLF